jgi:hypothetical protein
METHCENSKKDSPANAVRKWESKATCPEQGRTGKCVLPAVSGNAMTLNYYGAKAGGAKTLEEQCKERNGKWSSA